MQDVEENKKPKNKLKLINQLLYRKKHCINKKKKERVVIYICMGIQKTRNNSQKLKNKVAGTLNVDFC